jgi:hypothetical protein
MTLARMSEALAVQYLAGDPVGAIGRLAVDAAGHRVTRVNVVHLALVVVLWVREKKSYRHTIRSIAYVNKWRTSTLSMRNWFFTRSKDIWTPKTETAARVSFASIWRHSSCFRSL